MRAIGLLTFNDGGVGYFCTAWLVSSDTIVTAGHCVHEGAGGAFSTDGVFYPARNGDSSPYGSCTVRLWLSNSTWMDQGDAEYDYGAAKLNCTIGLTTGTLGYFWQLPSLVGLPVLIPGYPGDRLFGSMWSGSSDITVSEVRTTHYPQDTFGGQSGSPVLELDRPGTLCKRSCVNSIHAYGEDNGTNSGTRITEEVYNFIKGAIAEP